MGSVQRQWNARWPLCSQMGPRDTRERAFFNKNKAGPCLPFDDVTSPW